MARADESKIIEVKEETTSYQNIIDTSIAQIMWQHAGP